MKPLLLALLFLTVLVAAPVSATTLHVPADFPTIRVALDPAIAGDEVLVSPGTYFENLVIGSAQNSVRLVSVAGAQSTIIDGSRNASVILFSHVGSETVLQGFTLINGGADPLTTDDLGGGIRLSAASPLIQSNIVRKNFGASAGGIYMAFSSPTIVDNHVIANQAPFGSGGGIYVDRSSINTIIERNIIAFNGGAAFGGGVTIWNASEVILQSNTIHTNSATLDGGGVYITCGSVAGVRSNILTENETLNGIGVR